jgi:ketosteroid isomerase-like protein
MPDPTEVLAIARSLAQALDRNDFAGAARWIAPDCVYVMRGREIAGAPAILASYAESAEWAARQFDEVRYESEVSLGENGSAAVLYTDYLLKAPGRWHRHRCRQHLTLGAEGRVTRIVHEDLPGETESLEAYLRECGIERPGPKQV